MDDAHYRLLRLLDASPQLTQRELAREMCVSLGKVNYCVGALIEKGWVKVADDNYLDQSPALRAGPHRPGQGRPLAGA